MENKVPERFRRFMIVINNPEEHGFTHDKIKTIIKGIVRNSRKAEKTIKGIRGKMLKKPRRKREIFYYMCEELTDEKILS